MVYVLPEVRPLAQVFLGAVASSRTARADAVSSAARPGGTL
jgi:hypothetical protein